jgi:hypothetical protein
LSPQKSGRGAKGAKATKSTTKPAKRGASGKAAPGGARQVYVQSAKNDVFTYLLAVSLGAILIGVIFLVLILNKYDWKTKVAGIGPPSIATRTLS